MKTGARSEINWAQLFVDIFGMKRVEHTYELRRGDIVTNLDLDGRITHYWRIQHVSNQDGRWLGCSSRDVADALDGAE